MTCCTSPRGRAQQPRLPFGQDPQKKEKKKKEKHNSSSGDFRLTPTRGENNIRKLNGRRSEAAEFDLAPEAEHPAARHAAQGEEAHVHVLATRSPASDFSSEKSQMVESTGGVGINMV